MTHPNPGQFDDILRGPFIKGNVEHEAALAKLADNAREAQVEEATKAKYLRMTGKHAEADAVEEKAGLKGLNQAIEVRHAENLLGGTFTADDAERGEINFTGSDLAKVDRASEVHKQYGGDGDIKDIFALHDVEHDAKNQRES